MIDELLLTSDLGSLPLWVIQKHQQPLKVPISALQRTDDKDLVAGSVTYNRPSKKTEVKFLPLNIHDDFYCFAM